MLAKIPKHVTKDPNVAGKETGTSPSMPDPRVDLVAVERFSAIRASRGYLQYSRIVWQC